MVENCMEGYNSCMFAYGQTGSGKTHTMLGDIEGGARRHSVNCGMTPRVFDYLFARIQKDKDVRREEKLRFTCRCSFLEIYNEQIFDLLDPSSTNLQIREDSKKGVYVENLTEVEVTSARDVIQQLIQGAANRKVAATNMNRASSRSHSVFTCIMESKWESQGVTHHRFARLNLVDLAGSERQKSSGAEGERLKEATNINKSLSTLGLVIMNLVNISNGKSQHVPYRDSKLTFLLQDSLGGNAKTIIIANISPSSCCSLETLSTLKFAQRAKFIKNHAIVNEDASGDVLALRLENQNLKKEVSRLRGLVNGGVESHDGDVLSLAFPGSPGFIKWDGLRGLSSPLMSEKKTSHLHKKEYEVALVGAFRREKDKDTALQALAAENQATLQLAKQREDEIQSLKMRLRFREAGIKRLEAVASGKISAEIHLLKEKEEYLKEIEVLRAQVDRNQEVTRFAMENLRLKEEIRRLKSFCEEGERESLVEQIMILQNKLLEALDWKLMHESDPANIQKESPDMAMDIQSDDNFLSSNQESASPWRTSMNEENEFLRIQAIQNQSELDSLRKKLDFCIEEKEKLERHVSELGKELEAERLSKEVIAEQAQKRQTELPSLINDHIQIARQSDQTEIKTMVDAIAAASQREAEAHEMAILLSKENDELKMKLKVLIEDNNKLIDLYERAVADNSNKNYDGSLNPRENSIEDHNCCLTDIAEDKELETKREFESLKHQLAEMHEENDKDEFKRVIASGQCKIVGNKGEYSCPEKLVEVDEGQCLRFDESSIPVDEFEKDAIASLGPYLQNDNDDLDSEGHPVTISKSLLEQTSLYEVHVQNGYSQSTVDLDSRAYSDSNEAKKRSLSEDVNSGMLEATAADGMEIDELEKPEEQKETNEWRKHSGVLGVAASGTSNEYDSASHMNNMNLTGRTIPIDLLSLYEQAMQERDEFKRVIASGQCKIVGNKGEYSCPEKLVEVDEGQCLRFDESSIPVDEFEKDAIASLGPYLQNDNDDLDSEGHPVTISKSLLEQTSLYEVHVQNGYSQSTVDLDSRAYSDSNEAKKRSLSEDVNSGMLEATAADGMEIDELEKPEEQKETNEWRKHSGVLGVAASGTSNEYDSASHMNNMNLTGRTIPIDVSNDLNPLKKKLAEAQEKLADSAKMINAFCYLERAMIEVDALSEEISKLQSRIRIKQHEYTRLKSLSSELQEKKDVANKKLLAIKHSLTSFSSSVCYFEHREALARSRLNASSQRVSQRKDELTRLHVSRKELMDSILKFKQTETELRNGLENLRSKVEEENKKLESDRVLFAKDNVEKTAHDLSQKNWQISGKATDLLKSEEEKTKLQNQIKLNKENLVHVRQEAEAVNAKLTKMDNEIQVLKMELQKEVLSTEEMERKLQSIVREKEMLLEVKENGRNEFESMIIEYHQSLFEAELKEEEIKIMDEELVTESQKLEDLQRAKAEATRRKKQLLEAMSSCNSSFVSEKMEEDVHTIQKSVTELNFLLQQL
ncbi:Kinesin-like protein [Handroanthus impetiginosus]|uniref:Kinesin-like protein n=1 Tax=Handroanthus impetiginosus TaxID=429701 RepID=A0A2G9HU00_9LAMI|nr:Kinesin-like protein [Handroanthus impetiginosus]